MFNWYDVGGGERVQNVLTRQLAFRLFIVTVSLANNDRMLKNVGHNFYTLFLSLWKIQVLGTAYIFPEFEDSSFPLLSTFVSQSQKVIHHICYY